MLYPNGEVLISAGPSITVEDRLDFPDLSFAPPIKSGDIFDYLDRKPRAIGIIDGYFGDCLSIQHKEILCALGLGVPVVGAASMGALRAAELAPNGMIGIGGIFEDFRDGRLNADEAVAVQHAPAEFGYSPTNVATVDVQATIARLRQNGDLGAELLEAISSSSDRLHFAERTLDAIVEDVGSSKWDRMELRKLLDGNWVSRKRDDARGLLECMSSGAFDPVDPIPLPPRTCFLACTLHRHQSRHSVRDLEGLFSGG